MWGWSFFSNPFESKQFERCRHRLGGTHVPCSSPRAMATFGAIAGAAGPSSRLIGAKRGCGLRVDDGACQVGGCKTQRVRSDVWPSTKPRQSIDQRPVRCEIDQKS